MQTLPAARSVTCSRTSLDASLRSSGSTVQMPRFKAGIRASEGFTDMAISVHAIRASATTTGKHLTDWFFSYCFACAGYTDVCVWVAAGISRNGNDNVWQGPTADMTDPAKENASVILSVRGRTSISDRYCMPRRRFHSRTHWLPTGVDTLCDLQFTV